MRTILVALLLIALVPAASGARELPVIVSVEPIVELNDECKGCFTLGGYVSQGYAKNCADCGGIWAGVTVEKDEDSVTAHSEVCRGGFFTLCILDETVRV